MYPRNDMTSRKELADFLASTDGFYIYGAGDFGEQVYEAFVYYEGNRRFQGFLVSRENDAARKKLHGYPILTFDIGANCQECGIVVAMSKQYSREVAEVLRNREKVIYLWNEF